MEEFKHKEAVKSFDELLTIMDELREKCPWDKKQTFSSLSYLTIEETYELCDAILENNYEEIKKEIGDLLLHIVFYSKIGQEKNEFDIKDVISSLKEKLIRRHPHIYGNVEAKTARDVSDNWEEIKLKEGRKSALEGVPKSLPSMVKAYRIQDKARGVGFDWENENQVWDKVLEEIGELKEELENNNKDRIEAEFGDLLFALINYSRFIDINPEIALERTNKKFISRFKFLENEVEKSGNKLKDLPLEEMDVYWNKAKELENN
ncbi:MAG: nucleoside triphosphate pyrophosphohydrolase [Bacteroidales bacterium]|jgi:XTP/dITP diphosphohydrolase|nr:nucleoside triphosphate pyrophosphohydrolase [Bacteroidales bacterium]